MKFCTYALLCLILLASCKNGNVENKQPIASEINLQKEFSYAEINPRTDSILFEFGVLMSGSKTTVAENGLPLYSDSLLTKSTETKINIGDVVFVDFPLASHKVESGWEMTIYKVTVVKNGENFPGFLPQKYLVVNNLKLNDDNTLLLTLIPSSVTKYSDVIGRYTVINQKNEVLDYKEIPLIFTPDFVEDKSDNFIFSQNMRLSRNNTIGINGVNTVINSEMSYPACGYDSGCIYIFWDGKLLYHVLSKVEMYEAGLFSNYSHVVFPDKSVSERPQDTIYCQQIHSEQDDDNRTSSYDSTVLAYYWTRDKQIIGPDTLFTYKK